MLAAAAAAAAAAVAVAAAVAGAGAAAAAAAGLAVRDKVEDVRLEGACALALAGEAAGGTLFAATRHGEGGGGLAAVSTKRGGLEVLGAVSDPRMRGAAAVATNPGGTLAYVAAGGADSLTVVDVSSAKNPQVLGSVNHAVDLKGACSVATDGETMVYVAACSSGKVSAVDVSTPAAPEITAALQLSAAQSVHYAEGRLLVASGHARRVTSLTAKGKGLSKLFSLKDEMLDHAVAVQVGLTEDKLVAAAGAYGGSVSFLNVTDTGILMDHTMKAAGRAGLSEISGVVDIVGRKGDGVLYAAATRPLDGVGTLSKINSADHKLDEVLGSVSDTRLDGMTSIAVAADGVVYAAVPGHSRIVSAS